MRNVIKVQVTFIVLLVVSLGLAACGNTLQVGKSSYDRQHIPITNNETGAFNVNLLARHAAIEISSDKNMTLSRLEGSVLYNHPLLRPDISFDSFGAQLIEKMYREDFPDDAENRWSFSLGRQVPLNLNVTAGTARSTFDLGLVPVKTLNFKEGGDGTRLYFSKPNPISLEDMTVETGPGHLYLAGLAQANIKQALFICREGDLTLDFSNDSGKLAQPINNVLVKGSSANLTIFAAPVPAEIIVDSGDPGLVSAQFWTRTGKVFRNSFWATSEPSAPRLSIHVELNGGKVFLF